MNDFFGSLFAIILNMKSNVKIILIALLLIGLGAGAIFAFNSSPTREVKSFRNAICNDVGDQMCGYCPGEITKDMKCYVKRGTFEQYP